MSRRATSTPYIRFTKLASQLLDRIQRSGWSGMCKGGIGYQCCIDIYECIMRIKCLTLSIMMLAVIFPGLCPGRSQEQRAGRQIEIEKYWNGEAKIELRNLAPPEGFIANEKAWAELWKAYTGNEEFPKIDFDKHLILVVAGDDPNNIVINPDTLTLDEYGDLKPGHIQTAIGFENPKTFKYQFVLISLKGVKSINGKPIDSVNHEMN